MYDRLKQNCCWGDVNWFSFLHIPCAPLKILQPAILADRFMTSVSSNVCLGQSLSFHFQWGLHNSRWTLNWLIFFSCVAIIVVFLSSPLSTFSDDFLAYRLRPWRSSYRWVEFLLYPSTVLAFMIIKVLQEPHPHRSGLLEKFYILLVTIFCGSVRLFPYRGGRVQPYTNQPWYYVLRFSSAWQNHICYGSFSSPKINHSLISKSLTLRRQATFGGPNTD